MMNATGSATSRYYSSSSRPWPLTSLGVDWLSVTAHPGASATSLHQLAHVLLEEEVSVGMERSSWSSQGYKGERAGGVLVGSRDDGTMVTLTSRTARGHWKKVAGLAENVTRVDVQTTATTEGEEIPVARLLHEDRKDAPKRAGRPITGRYIEGTDGGSTCYFGAPSSDKQARVYDKGVESEIAPPGHVWRWEVQLRREYARSGTLWLLNHRSEEDAVKGLVWEHFAGLGFPPPYDASSARIHCDDRETSDRARKLSYISRCVAPMVRKLMNTGDPQEVLAALGL